MDKNQGQREKVSNAVRGKIHVSSIVVLHWLVVSEPFGFLHLPPSFGGTLEGFIDNYEGLNGQWNIMSMPYIAKPLVEGE